MMRLLFLNHNFHANGTFYRAMPMAEQLARRGHEVTLLCVSNDRRWRPRWSSFDRVHLGEMPRLALGDTAEGYGPLDLVLRCALASRRPFDLVQMFDHKPNASFPGLFARWRGASLVADWADWWTGLDRPELQPRHRFGVIGHFEAFWEVRQKLWADGVVAISQALRQRAIDIGCPSQTVLYLLTAAAIERIRPLPIEAARRALQVPPERQIVGYIGMGQSDLEIVMQAVQDLPGVWLMIIGKKWDRTAELAARFGLADRLWQTGFVADEEVGTYLACANLMVLPLSDNLINRGRLPTKILDYKSAGRATVASPVGDIRDMIERQGVGLLAQNPAEFAAAIGRLLGDRALRDKIQVRARQAAETEFNWNGRIPRLEEFYDQIIRMHRDAQSQRGLRRHAR